jgi:hypothetical protein
MGELRSSKRASQQGWLVLGLQATQDAKAPQAQSKNRVFLLSELKKAMDGLFSTSC